MIKCIYFPMASGILTIARIFHVASLTIGTASTSLSLRISFVLFAMYLMYGRANLAKRFGPRIPALDSNTCTSYKT